MSFFEYRSGKEYMARMDHDSDLMLAVAELAKSNGVKVGSFTAIGALKHAKFGYYDQQKHEYQEIEYDRHCEIASCIGNVSLKNGDVFVHAHVVLSDEAGNGVSGHLLNGIIFAAEVHLRELIGPSLKRKYDDVTGLSLWDIKSG